MHNYYFKIKKKQITRIAKFLSIIIVLLSLLEALDIYRAVGIILTREQIIALILGISLALIYISFPLQKKKEKKQLPWYDLISAIFSFAVCFYITINWTNIIDTLFDKPSLSLITAIIFIFLIAEAIRRTVGLVMFLFFIFFIILGLLGHFIPAPFQGNNISFDRMFLYVGLDPNGIIGLPLGIVVSIVITFIFFGNLLNESGGSKFFIELASAIMGKYRGSSAKIAILSSSLFGSISGSAVSNVVFYWCNNYTYDEKGRLLSRKSRCYRSYRFHWRTTYATYDGCSLPF